MATVCISSNQSPEYLFYLPITSFVYGHFGFKTLCFIVGESELCSLAISVAQSFSDCTTVTLASSQIYRSETIAQISRLYAGCVVKEDEYILTADIDMIPLSDYLYRDFGSRNLFGYDLTGRTMFPMCYVGMSSEKWRNFMEIDVSDPVPYILRDLETLRNRALSNYFADYWYIDQFFLTRKVMDFGIKNFISIERGRESSGLAKNRVDRANWSWNHDERYIDCHMLKNSYSDESFFRTYEIICHTLKKDVPWMLDYQREFSDLIKKTV